MKSPMHSSRLALLIPCIFLCLACNTQEAKNEKTNDLLDNILQSDGLLALWSFKEEAGQERMSHGPASFPLAEAQGRIERVPEGPVSGYSIKLEGNNYLVLGNAETGKLNIHGDSAQLTVVAWVKWTGGQTGFVGGMWNEYEDGGKRQYGLFVSLPHYNGADQVCGHISRPGKPTPPFPYSIDYSASGQQVPHDEWCCVAFTYDGQNIKSYLNGEFQAREPELIDNTIGFEGYPDGLVQRKNPYSYPEGMGNNGSDFTVGAVRLKSGMGNYYKGLIGGLAVYNRVLSEQELIHISE